MHPEKFMALKCEKIVLTAPAGEWYQVPRSCPLSASLGLSCPPPLPPGGLGTTWKSIRPHGEAEKLLTLITSGTQSQLDLNIAQTQCPQLKSIAILKATFSAFQGPPPSLKAQEVPKFKYENIENCVSVNQHLRSISLPQIQGFHISAVAPLGGSPLLYGVTTI